MAVVELLCTAEDTCTRLRREVVWASNVRIAVGYVSEDGLEKLQLQAAVRGRDVRVVVMADPGRTAAGAIEKLRQWLQDNVRVIDRGVVAQRSEGPTYYHGKLFIFIRGKRCRIYMGSSNLTGGGLGRETGRWEIGALLQCKRDSVLAKRTMGIFEQLWAYAHGVTDEWLAAYRELCRKASETAEHIAGEIGEVEPEIEAEPSKMSRLREELWQGIREIAKRLKTTRYQIANIVFEVAEHGEDQVAELLAQLNGEDEIPCNLEGSGDATRIEEVGYERYTRSDGCAKGRHCFWQPGPQAVNELKSLFRQLENSLAVSAVTFALAREALERSPELRLEALHEPGQATKGASSKHLCYLEALRRALQGKSPLAWVPHHVWRKAYNALIAADERCREFAEIKKVGGSMREHYLLPFGWIQRRKRGKTGGLEYRITSLGRYMLDQWRKGT